MNSLGTGVRITWAGEISQRAFENVYLVDEGVNPMRFTPKILFAALFFLIPCRTILNAQIIPLNTPSSSPLSQPTLAPGVLQLMELEGRFAQAVAAGGGKAFGTWF